MNVDRAVMIFAGFMIFASLALTYFVHPMWWLLTAFEKYFMRKIRTGSSEPGYERVIMKAIGVQRLLGKM